MKYGNKYKLGYRLFENIGSRKVKKIDRSSPIVAGAVFELGKAAEDRGGVRSTRAYIEAEDIQKEENGSIKYLKTDGNTVAYYNKKGTIKLFPLDDNLSSRLVFQVVGQGSDIPMEITLAGKEMESDGKTINPAGASHQPRAWVAGYFKKQVTLKTGTRIKNLRGSDLPSGVVLVLQSSLKNLEDIASDRFISDEVEQATRDRWAALQSKHSVINRLLEPAGTKVAWTTALEMIYGVADEGEADKSWPVKESEIAAVFNKKEGDGGRGEILADNIFPNLVAIGAAGAEAGVDLFDVISKRKIEVKESGNFRIGTKSRRPASVAIDLIKNALVELETKINAKKDLITALTETELKQQLSQLSLTQDENGKPQPTEGEKNAFYDFVGNFTGCTGCDDGYYNFIKEEIEAGWLDPTQLAFGDIKEAVELIYENILEDLEYDINKTFSGELTKKRSLKAVSYFNIVKIDTAGLTSSIYDGAINQDGTFDLSTIEENIANEYIKALNPEFAFKGTDIMVASDTSFVIYTGEEMGQKLRAAADSASASVSGTFTQGAIQLTINIAKETERMFADDIGVTLAPEAEQEGDAPGTQQNNSKQYNRLQKLFEWAVK